MLKIPLNKGFQAMTGVYMPFMLSTLTSYAVNQFVYQNDYVEPKKDHLQVHLKATKAFVSSITSDVICNDLKSNFLVYKGCSWFVKEFLGNGIDYSMSLLDSHDDYTAIDSI